MSSSLEFLESLKKAVSSKKQWFNATDLPKMLENYKLLCTCTKNLYEILEKRGLIVPDPYKNESKISKIKAPDTSNFPETERAVIIGTRFSDYESMLEFLSTYFQFSVDNLDIPNIKRLMELNATFQWTNLSPSSKSINTRELANLLNNARKNLPTLSVSLMNDSLSKSSEAITEINQTLKQLTDFKREEYKLEIRTNIMQSHDFNTDKATNENDEMAEIKRVFSKISPKKPFYAELITEIAKEDFSNNQQNLQRMILDKLKIPEVIKKQVKKEVDTKEIVLENVRILCPMAPTYSLMVEKLMNNRDVLENSKAIFFEKLKKSIRKSFKMKEPPIIYKFVITDQATQAKSHRDVDINNFITSVYKKAHLLEAIANKSSSEYRKIESSSEEVILQFLNKQIAENKEIFTLLVAADDFFKANVAHGSRAKIKGLKIDLVTINNTIVKANKKCGEYLSMIEESEQLKKLGITEEQ